MDKKENTNNISKVILIILIFLVAVILVSFAYALIKENYKVEQKITTGTLQIKDINLQIEDRLTGTMQDKITKWSPGDASLLTWETVNEGTSAAKTKHTIIVYWDNENINKNVKDLLYIYPANISNEEVLKDFNNEKQLAIPVTTRGEIQIDDKTKTGISYTFYGDTLDGTDKTGVATQVDYDAKNIKTEGYTTVENEALVDKIGVRILLSPETSYLLQEETISVRVITDAMQYTEDGETEWEVQSIQEL